MKLIALPHYFIVKIDKEKQNERREKIGRFYTHFNEIQMQRNMQNGEIIAIGEIAGSKFKDAKIGDILIFHHFVEGSDRDTSSLIFSDDTFNYYNVTACEYNGRRNETYGVASNGKIIPHPDFIFIETAPKEVKLEDEDYIEKHTKKEGSLILFTDWKESRDTKEERAKTLMTEVKNMSNTKRDDVRRALEDKQREAEKITSSLSKKEYLPYKIDSYNSEMNGLSNKTDPEFVYALNIASDLKVEYDGVEYAVINSKYCVATS